METIVYVAAFAACSGNSCQAQAPVQEKLQPVPVVIYHAAPRPLFPLFAPRPQVIVVPVPSSSR